MTTEPLLRPVAVGGLLLKNNLALAPMAGITNAAFRILASGGGAGLVVTEMVSAESLKYGNKKSFKMLELLPGEHPAAIQLFGADPASMALAAQAAERAGADAVDINAGCPVRKVRRSGAGAELMRTPLLLADLISRAVKCVKVPVTVKFRVGLEAGCAGVAVGRAAVFNPSVFAEIAAGLSGGRLPEPDSGARMRLFLRFLELNAGIYGEEHGLTRARKLVGFWLKGLPNASAARGAFMKLKTLKEAEELLIQYTK